MSAFTAVHRALGERPGPLTDAMIEALVDQAVPEGGDLEFKKQFPSGSLPDSDFPKDLAALANAGGGIIVYGISETDGKATHRTDVELTERLESGLRRVASSKIAPGLINLAITALGESPHRCVVIEVPASSEVPHLYFPNEGGLRAPLRVGADTHWMTERQIEAAYRTRFARAQDRAADLADLYQRIQHDCDTDYRAWFIAAAVPRDEVTQRRLPLDDAQQIFWDAVPALLQLAPERVGPRRLPHPVLDGMNRTNLRPGLRSWVAPRLSAGGRPSPSDATASIGDSGAVTLATVVGGHTRPDDRSPGGHEVVMEAIECALADFLGLLRATAEHLPVIDYDLQFGVAWTGDQDLQLLLPRHIGPDFGDPIRETTPFLPVRATLATNVDDATFHRHAYELARDCANQAAAPRPVAFTEPTEPS